MAAVSSPSSAHGQAPGLAGAAQTIRPARRSLGLLLQRPPSVHRKAAESWGRVMLEAASGGRHPG